MAQRRDLDFTYSLTDRIVRLSLGELADFSAAKYDGDFSLSLEQAQRRKHDYVAAGIGIGPGRRVLDLGCGWAACSPRAKEEIYSDFFERVASVLPGGGRFYLQSMVFGRSMIDAEQVSTDAPRRTSG